ncbi:MAG: 30S ribosomal protein S4 [Anaerolineaceae bacterium 4572_78]|nr:MAG: 30S ribosomal protein S4 [Anaerolineaceae bacterium 4572_78]
MNYTGPKVRLSRYLGVPLTPKAARVMEKKPHPPGQHGTSRKRFSKISDYKRQLVEKQRLRCQYNVSEKQMVNYYKRASQRFGNNVDNIVQVLETRLDAIVLRAGLARTIYAARQYVSHRHILVNGKRVNIPSYNVEIGDVVAVKPKSQKMVCFEDALESIVSTPDYIERSKKDMSVKLLYLPKRDEVPIICDVPLVIEYYSR